MTMKVRELIERLQACDAEQEVHIGYNYGDCNNTVVCPAVRQVDECYLIESEYFKAPTIRFIDLDDDELEKAPDPVVVLFCMSNPY